MIDYYQAYILLSILLFARNFFKKVCPFIKLEDGVAKMLYFSELHFILSK